MIDIRDNFEKRNIEFEFIESREDLMDKIKIEILAYETIGIGNSQTLKALGVSSLASSLGKKVFDKTLARDKNDIKRLKKEALTADCYISSSNAIAREGVLVNVDHSGNRVAAMTYGPERVLIIVGRNKIVDDEASALKRALKVSTPLNAKRASIESPCSCGLACNQCNQAVRVCNYISVIRGQHEKGRMKVYVLDEDLGY